MLAVSVGVVVLLVAACDGPQPRGSNEPGGSAGSSMPPTTERARPGGSGSAVAPKIEPSELPGDARVVEGTPLPPERIDGTALPRNYPRKVHVTGDGTSLAIVAKEGGCGKAAAEVVGQTAREVTVVLVETMPEGQVACTMEVRFPTVTVELAEPLGKREVVLRARQE